MAHQNDTEQTRAIQLAEQRNAEKSGQERKRGLEKTQSEIKKIKDELPPEVGFIEAATALTLALGSDIIDWLIVGSIPILGDILDIATWTGIAFWIWWRRLKRPPSSLQLGILELIPFLDVLPVWTAMVAYILIYNIMRRAQARKKIQELHALEKRAKATASA